MSGVWEYPPSSSKYLSDGTVVMSGIPKLLIIWLKIVMAIVISKYFQIESGWYVELPKLTVAQIVQLIRSPIIFIRDGAEDKDIRIIYMLFISMGI